MSCWLFFRRCSLCRGLANLAIHLTPPVNFLKPNEVTNQQLSAARGLPALEGPGPNSNHL